MILTSLILIHCLVGIYDFSFYRIPNLFLALLIGLYGVYASIYLSLDTILESLAIFGVILISCFGLYRLKIMGAGDAKYMAVTSLWFGANGILPLLLLIALTGGLQALMYLAFRNLFEHWSEWTWLKIQEMEKHYPKLQTIWIGSDQGPERGKNAIINLSKIPYGLSIAFGSIVMLITSKIIYQ